MFEKFKEKMEKYPGKKYMDLKPEERDGFEEGLDALCKELAEFLGSDSILLQLSTKNGTNNTHYYWQCGVAQMLNMIESAMARMTRAYDKGVFAAVSAYHETSTAGEISDGEMFAQVVRELPSDQQRAIIGELKKMRTKLGGDESKTSDKKDDSDAINDLLG